MSFTSSGRKKKENTPGLFISSVVSTVHIQTRLKAWSVCVYVATAPAPVLMFRLEFRPCLETPGGRTDGGTDGGTIPG